MACMLAAMTAADSADSLEIRWIVHGCPTAATRDWASVGFEASGSPALLHPALDRAVGVMFAAAPAGWLAFDLDHCRSYSQLLYQLPGEGCLWPRWC